MTRVVFWQNMLAFYQVPHIAALAATPGYQVTWVVKELVAPERVAQGWSVPKVENVEVVVDPNRKQIRGLIDERPSDSIHIFTGVHLEPLAKSAFELCVKTPAVIGLLNEPPIPGGLLRNLAVPPFHIAHRLLYGNKISFVLAIGHMSVRHYRSVGFEHDKVFSYGYFPELASRPAFDRSGDAAFRLMYLGQLIPRKGVDLLLHAAAELRDRNWQLTIMGSGPSESELHSLSGKLGISDRVTFKPPAANAIALAEVAKHDLFLLPSRHDGWGAVVNEALMCGVPVVCSDRCGASDLLKDSWRGGQFRAGDVASLTELLREWVAKGSRTKLESDRIQQWCSHISGRSAAGFLASVAEYAGGNRLERPVPPWM